MYVIPNFKIKNLRPLRFFYIFFKIGGARTHLSALRRFNIFFRFCFENLFLEENYLFRRFFSCVIWESRMTKKEQFGFEEILFVWIGDEMKFNAVVFAAALASEM